MNAILFSNVPVHTVRMVGFIFAPTEPEGSIICLAAIARMKFCPTGRIRKKDSSQSDVSK